MKLMKASVRQFADAWRRTEIVQAPLGKLGSSEFLVEKPSRAAQETPSRAALATAPQNGLASLASFAFHGLSRRCFRIVRMSYPSASQMLP